MKLYFFPIIVWVSIAHGAIHLEGTVHVRAGFFYELLQIMESLIHYEHEGLASVHIDWTHEFFPYKDSPHENGWDLYFEPIYISAPNNIPTSLCQVQVSDRYHELHTNECVAPWILYDQYLPYRSFVNQKLTQYIHIKKHIQERVESFFNTHIKGFFCIGVHVRFSSAHHREVPGGHLPTLEEYFKEVDTIIRSNPEKNIKIYVASDSHYAINKFKERYPRNLLYIEAFRAQKSEEPHLLDQNGAASAKYWMDHPDEWHLKKPGYYGGLTSLLDCLLLARCDYLIHTVSNLSTFVCFFNPTIKSVYLPRNTPYKACFLTNGPIKNQFLNPPSIYKFEKRKLLLHQDILKTLQPLINSYLMFFDII